jgi:hypothetical protein
METSKSENLLESASLMKPIEQERERFTPFFGQPIHRQAQAGAVSRQPFARPGMAARDRVTVDKCKRRAENDT